MQERALRTLPPMDARSPLRLWTLPSPAAGQPPGERTAGWGWAQVDEDVAPTALAWGGPPPMQRRGGRGTVRGDGWDLQLQLAMPLAKPAQLTSALGSVYVQQAGAWPGDPLPPLAPGMTPRRQAPCLCAPRDWEPSPCPAGEVLGTGGAGAVSTESSGAAQGHSSHHGSALGTPRDAEDGGKLARSLFTTGLL